MAKIIEQNYLRIWENNMATPSRFTKKAQNALNGAMKFAGEMGHTYIGTEHVLMALAFESAGRHSSFSHM